MADKLASTTPNQPESVESQPSSNQQKSFSITQALQTGWEYFQKRPGFYVSITLIQLAISFGIPFFVQMLFGGSTNASESAENPYVAISRLLSNLMSFILSLGAIRIYLDSMNGGTPEVGDLLKPRVSVWQYILLSLVSGVIIFVGFLLFIIPGIIMSLALSMATYILFDERVQAMEAIQKSRDMTKGIRMKLFLFFLASSLVNAVGVMLLGVGYLVTVPVTSLATVYVFKTLKSQTT